MDLASERPDFPTEAWLPPGGNTFFEAFVDTQVPCRIALDYRVESEVGRRLSGVFTNLPSTSLAHRTRTGVINLRQEHRERERH
jgi:hypothetical protein